MILVDPARVIIGAGLVALLMFAVGFWLGRRWGYIEGVGVWRKSYRLLSSEIKERQEVTRQMGAGKSGQGE